MYLRIRSSAFEINPVLTPISLSRLTVDHDGQGQNENQCQILALPLGRVEFEQDWSLRQGSTSSNVRYPCRLSNLFKSAGPRAGMARSRSAKIPGSSRLAPAGRDRVERQVVDLPVSGTPDPRIHSLMSRVHHRAGSIGGLAVRPHSGYSALTLLKAKDAHDREE